MQDLAGNNLADCRAFETLAQLDILSADALRMQFQCRFRDSDQFEIARVRLVPKEAQSLARNVA